MWMIKYLIQAFVILTDIILLAGVAWIIYSNPKSPITWILSVLTFLAWQNTGGFMAWEKENIKKFFANMKKLGL